MLCYALKANANLAVIRTLAEEGAGADIVSAGELQRALAAGVPPQRIVFSGVGKSRDEMVLALDARIAQFNVELVPELVVLGEVAAARKLAAPVALRINPDVAARRARQDQHRPAPRQVRHRPRSARSRSTTSRAASAGIEIVGLHLHIGSQILSLAPFEAAFRRGMELVDGAAPRRDPDPPPRSRRRPRRALSPGPEPELDLAGYARLVRRADRRATTSSWCSSPGASWWPRPACC